jgi:hypothetical protein
MLRIFRSFCVVKSREMMWKSGLRNGRKKTTSNLQVAENMYIALSRNRRLILRTTENKLNLNIESIRSTTYRDLEKRWVCVGKLWLTFVWWGKTQKAIEYSTDIMNDTRNWTDCPNTVKTWHFHYDPEVKRYKGEWRSPMSPVPKSVLFLEIMYENHSDRIFILQKGHL